MSAYEVDKGLGEAHRHNTRAKNKGVFLSEKTACVHSMRENLNVYRLSMFWQILSTTDLKIELINLIIRPEDVVTQ